MARSGGAIVTLSIAKDDVDNAGSGAGRVAPACAVTEVELPGSSI